jgi:predicted cupin superfamily sugar epimerase
VVAAAAAVGAAAVAAAAPTRAGAIAGDDRPRGGAGELIATLGLTPHPEGGWFRETLRAPSLPGTRAAWSVIYFLLRHGERSAWHRVRDAAEIWYFHSGAPLELSIAAAGRTDTLHLGDPAQGHPAHALVPPGAWQAARSLGDWTLVSCQVTPAFEYSAFELAPPGWHP